MCLLVFAWNRHPRYRLVFAGNRDEFHLRPTQFAYWWDDAPMLLAGRDLEAGGTWLGFSRDGRFAVVTNFREHASSKPPVRSRGILVSEFLRGVKSPKHYGENVRESADQYRGFSLIFGDGDELLYFSNRDEGLVALEPGVYGLSNHLLNTPWPKVERAKTILSRLLKDENSIDTDALFAMLADRETAALPDLPDTGIGMEAEKLLSAPFVVTPAYGTRCSTILTVDDRDKVCFLERNFDSNGDIVADRRFVFALEE